MTHTPHIVIAGGGVAAIEAVVALRALAGPRPRLTLLSPDDELPQRAASTAAPFGFGLRAPLPYDVIKRRVRFDVHRGLLSHVDTGAHVVVDDAGEELSYDKLLVAVGARPEPALEGAITFSGPADVSAVSLALESATRLAFVLPSASMWALPVYELAIMAAVELRDRGVEPEITVITPETAPLWVFGPEASAAIAELLAARGIALRTGAQAASVGEGTVEIAGQGPVAVERVIALPRVVGPAVPGLPQADGFIPVDAHGRVKGYADVFAAGDATTFPLKQGGLATQQADAAAETIAADLGALGSPTPFRPVMRGLLLTGGAPLYLRASLTAEGEPESRTSRRAAQPKAAVSQRALWWPPGKIAGRYLAPLLATARPPALGAGQLQDYTASAAAEDRDEALELALLLAEADAESGDFRQALRALDAAAALTGGVLPTKWEQRRRKWAAI